MTSLSPPLQTDILQIGLASPIKEYHEEKVQTIHALSSTKMKFEGAIVYDVTYSACAIHSIAPWVVLDPLAAAQDEDVAGEEGEEVFENVIKGGVIGEEKVQ